MRVLVVKTSSLGDIIHGLRVVASLKERIPGLHITWIAQEAFAPIVRLSLAVDETIVFRKKQLLSGVRGVLKTLRPLPFDAAIDLQGRFLTGLMASRSGAPRRIGRTDSREGAGIFYNERVPLPPAGRSSHALEILLEFCRPFGLKKELPVALRFRVPSEPALKLATKFPGRNVVLIFPDSRRAEKCWEGFTALSEMILQQNLMNCVVWAGDRRLPYRGSSSTSPRFLNLTGQSPLMALPGLLAQAGWVISNDSGPMHLAAALGIKVFGIFGPTKVSLYGPYPPANGTNFSVTAPKGNLRLLPPEEVLYSLKQFDPAFFSPPPVAPKYPAS